MNATAFDTLEAARQLQAAGFEPRQAEAIVGAFRQAQGPLVTTDQLDARLAALETRLTRAMLVQAGSIVAATVAPVTIVIMLAS